MSLMDRDYYWEDRDKKNKRQTNIMRIRKKSRVNKKAVFFFAFLIAFLAVIGYVDNYGIPQTVSNTLSNLGIDISEADIKDLKSSYDDAYWEEDTYNEIYNGIVNYQTNISLSIPYSNQNSDIISRQYKRVIDEHPELFWLDGSGGSDSDRGRPECRSCGGSEQGFPESCPPVRRRNSVYLVKHTKRPLSRVLPFG